MASERKTIVELQERLHPLRRVKRAALKEGATIQDVLEAIEYEEADILEMLYQQPPLSEDK